MITLVIDIGGTKLAAALIGIDGQIRDCWELPTPASQTPQALYDTLSAPASLLRARVQWVAIASARIIRDGSPLALNPHNLGGLLYFPLVKTLEQLINLPAIAINDAQTTAWAEYQALDGGITDMVLITVSTDVGGDVVSGGKLCTSLDGLAGHIGHTLADSHGPACGRGRTSHVEMTASGRDIVTVAQGELVSTNTKAIFTRAEQGDEQAQQLTHRSTRTPARLIADIEATIDCQCVMVGGSVSLVEGYLALMEACLAQEPVAFHVDLPAVYYRYDASLPGAVLSAWGEIL